MKWKKSSISAEISDSRDGLPRENFGELCYDGIRFERNSQTVLARKPIQPEQKYTLTTVDHFQFVPFFPTIELVGEVEFLFPDVLRTVVANYLHAHYPIK